MSALTGIRFEKIDKRYGGLYALRRVSLDIPGGQCVALVGRNGSGKTTLLRVASRLVRPSSGTLTFVGGGDAAEPAEKARTAYVAHATMVYDELTARENLALFAKLQGTTEPQRRVDQLLEDVGLGERRDSLVRTFSRGMRQRIAIARALLDRPAVLLLDEPGTGLDPEGSAWLAQTLRSLRDTGCTIVMTLHGESEISALAVRAIRLDAGAVVADTQAGASLRSVLAFAGA